MTVPDRSQLADHAQAITEAVLRACDPAVALERAWTPELDSANRVVLIAAGKGSAAMAAIAVERLRERVIAGAVATVPDHADRVRAAARASGATLTVHEADHPLPTDRNRVAAKAIADAAGLAGEQDLVLALISGGASAHLAMPADGVTLDDLRETTSALLRAGAEIAEVNAVRKHCEVLKGGGLARLVWPARLRAFVLSDVLGDRLDAIGSGPTAPDTTTFEAALAVLDRYDLRRVSPSITARLVRGARGEEQETPKAGDPIFERSRHQIIASNRVAIDAAVQACEGHGFVTHRVEQDITGEASTVAEGLVAVVNRACAEHDDARCIVLGGETTVTVGDAAGTGGPCQEVALRAAVGLDGNDRAAVLTLATDGIDGPTAFAGGLVDGRSAGVMIERGVDPVSALEKHAATDALGTLGGAETGSVGVRGPGLISTGPTGTNVNDVMIALIYPGEVASG